MTDLTLHNEKLASELEPNQQSCYHCKYGFMARESCSRFDDYWIECRYNPPSGRSFPQMRPSQYCAKFERAVQNALDNARNMRLI